MIRTTLVSAAAALALLAPLPPATAASRHEPVARSATSVTGHWQGKVYGDDGGPTGYVARVRIFRDHGTLRGRVAYPGYCSGVWVFKGTANGWSKFREKITSDPGAPTCVSPVTVKVRRKDAKLSVVWTEPKTGDRGTMLAHRS